MSTEAAHLNTRRRGHILAPHFSSHNPEDVRRSVVVRLGVVVPNIIASTRRYRCRLSDQSTSVWFLEAGGRLDNRAISDCIHSCINFLLLSPQQVLD